MLYVVGAGFLIWTGRAAIASFVFSKRKEQINKLEARISVLKLHLKAKVTRKCNKVEDVFRNDAKALEAVRPAIRVLADITFNKPADYQHLIVSLQAVNDQVSDYIKLKHKNLQTAARAAAENDVPAVLSAEEQTLENCKKLIRYDKANVLIVTQIMQATEEMLALIEEFNNLVQYAKSQKKISEIPDKIEIENHALLVSLLGEGAQTPAAADGELPGEAATVAEATV